MCEWETWPNDLLEQKLCTDQDNTTGPGVAGAVAGEDARSMRGFRRRLDASGVLRLGRGDGHHLCRRRRRR